MSFASDRHRADDPNTTALMTRLQQSTDHPSLPKAGSVLPFNSDRGARVLSLIALKQRA